MALTHVQITKAKPRDKPYKLFDGGGLYLLVNPTGSKCWRLKYRFNNKEYLLSFGQYPDVTLAEARERLAIKLKSFSRKVLIQVKSRKLSCARIKKKRPIHLSQLLWSGMKSIR